jgi:hypothetical protein
MDTIFTEVGGNFLTFSKYLGAGSILVFASVAPAFKLAIHYHIVGDEQARKEIAEYYTKRPVPNPEAL